MAINNDLRELQKAIGYKFKNQNLLKQALMHTSYVFEARLEKIDSNQRMEFLGDAVLELAITNILYEKLPNADEGELSSLRAKLVCTAGLARVARGIGLSKYIILGRGAEKGREHENPTVLEDTFEAIVGAVYLDGGWRKTFSFIRDTFEVCILNALEGKTQKYDSWDKKTSLQIELQKRGSVKIKYKLVREEGPPHEKVFFVEVYLGKELLGSGNGNSKKEAEQNAAGKALEAMNVS
jgi:ribonuclease-3